MRYSYMRISIQPEIALLAIATVGSRQNVTQFFSWAPAIHLGKRNKFKNSEVAFFYESRTRIFIAVISYKR